MGGSITEFFGVDHTFYESTHVPPAYIGQKASTHHTSYILIQMLFQVTTMVILVSMTPPHPLHPTRFLPGGPIA